MATQAWDDRQDEILREMWLKGYLAVDIAAAILEVGGPRRGNGSIFGRRERLNLPPRSPKLQKKSTKSAKRLNAKVKAPRVVAVAPLPKTDTHLTKAPGARLVPFLDICPGECHFVVEEHPTVMCGAPVSVPGGAWCAFHRRLVYVPRNKVAEEIHRINSIAKMTVAQDLTAR